MSVREFRIGYFDPIPKDSDYGFKILPPDSPSRRCAPATPVSDIYRTIASGIGGTRCHLERTCSPSRTCGPWPLRALPRRPARRPAATVLRKTLVEAAWWTPRPPTPASAR